MADIQVPLRSRFRAPDGRLLLYCPNGGEQATHAVMQKEDNAEHWTILGAYRNRGAAERKLEQRVSSASASELLIIECEPY